MNQEPITDDPLVSPGGPVLDDDFLVLCGKRNRRNYLSSTESSEPADKTQRTEQPAIGVLAIQGDYAAHAAALAEAGARPVEVRKAEELDGLDGLVLPGGESTTMLKFLEKNGFFEALEKFCGAKPVFATCAGVILLAREVRNPAQRSLGALDAVVERNAYGRQIDSAILTAETRLAGGPMEMVYIRAPRILETGAGVEVLAERDGSPTLVREGLKLAATFHPELSADRRVHRAFVEIVSKSAKPLVSKTCNDNFMEPDSLGGG